jgi:hypothetical protein
MPLLDPTPRSTVWRERLALALQLASLALTGWALWGARLLARWGQFAIGPVIGRAALYALAAWAAGAAITLALYLGAMQWESEDVIHATIRTSKVSIWFAPSVILFTQTSPAAIAAASVLVITATRLLYHEWRLKSPLPEVPPPRSDLFVRALLPRPQFWHDVAPGLAAAFTVQTGVAAVMLHRPLLAGVAFATGLSLATIFATIARAAPARRPDSLPRSVLGLLLTIVLAIGLTVAGMLPHWMQGGGDGFGFGSGSATASAEPQKRDGGAGTSDLPKATDAAFAEGGFPGVILWPEVKPYATLIAPMPQRADGLATVESRPMSIPFSGEYWMYRWPFARPPGNSIRERGTPSALSFKTTDHRPLEMEARHKLDQPIALSCCRMIQLAILNADRFPNTISLELALINSDLPDAPALSLGREPVVSVPDLHSDSVRPVPETIGFPVPATAHIEAFNELKIVFYRDRRRMDQSAKVAIDRFVLIPRI